MKDTMNFFKPHIQGGLYTLRALKEVNDYIFQFTVLNRVSSLFDQPLRNTEIAKKYQKELIKEVWRTINWDKENIIRGIYPETVLKHRSLWQKTQGMIKILWDYPKVISRRKKNQTLLRQKNAEQFPEYFTRAFHFQTDGYLSKKSAELYEHQVDILFTGLSDIMRRSFFPFLVRHLPQDRSLNILEMACGTGRGSEMLKEVFPNASFTLNDLSPHYLEFAKRKFQDEERFSFIQGEANNLKPLKDNSFDLSFHIYLFHEIPHETRKAVLEEQIRLTKDEGFIIICDSLQTSDRPQWKEVLEDFPKRYHEPYYRNFLEDDFLSMAKDLGLTLVHEQKVLLTKCLIFKK
jgi:ubiquinone/menaquinone biosynthesis C-methylase UbiE